MRFLAAKIKDVALSNCKEIQPSIKKPILYKIRSWLQQMLQYRWKFPHAESKTENPILPSTDDIEWKQEYWPQIQPSPHWSSARLPLRGWWLSAGARKAQFGQCTPLNHSSSLNRDTKAQKQKFRWLGKVCETNELTNEVMKEWMNDTCLTWMVNFHN